MVSHEITNYKYSRELHEQLINFVVTGIVNYLHNTRGSIAGITFSKLLRFAEETPLVAKLREEKKRKRNGGLAFLNYQFYYIMQILERKGVIHDKYRTGPHKTRGVWCYVIHRDEIPWLWELAHANPQEAVKQLINLIKDGDTNEVA